MDLAVVELAEQEAQQVLALYLVQSLQLVAEAVEETLLHQDLLVDLAVVVLGEVVLAVEVELLIKDITVLNEIHHNIEVVEVAELVNKVEQMDLVEQVEVTVLKQLLMELLHFSVEGVQVEVEPFLAVKAVEVTVLK